MLFLDMLGAQKLHICNSKVSETPFDTYVKELGGKIYTKCYSPAPDTPRAAACMWSGVYPKRNGCNNRVKWPQKDLNRSLDNIWSIFQKMNYDVNVYCCESNCKLGLIPFTGKENVYKKSVYEFLNKAKITENSFSFFYLPDLHYILSEMDYSEEGYTEGNQFLTNIVKEIVSFYQGGNVFDCIMMFSDHGYKADNSLETHMLSKERTNTFMYMKNKGDIELVKDEKIRSLLDVMPTICNKIGYKWENDIDGKDLNDTTGHTYVLMEDLGDFWVDISQTVEHWGVVLEDNTYHWFECEGRWSHEAQSQLFDEDQYTRLLQSKMSDLDRNLALYQTAKEYKEYTEKHPTRDTYSTGDPFYRLVYTIENRYITNNTVVLYGAGRVGRDYYDQIIGTHLCKISGWVDLNYLEIASRYNRKIVGINRLDDLQYDFIIIAVADANVVKNIKLMLTQLGVEEGKIIWEKPKIIRQPI